MKCVAFTLAIGLVWCAGGCAGHDATQHSVVKMLMTQTLPAGSGSEVRMLTVEYPPGVSSPSHHHPGAVFVYVVEGEVLCGLDDEPVKRFAKGESWWERPGQVHRVAANASCTQSAKLLVFFVTEAGKPVLVPEGKN